MINIGLNYITEKEKLPNKYDDIYKFLINEGYINTLKFPGKYCNLEILKKVFEISKQTNAKIDIHGLPGMIPAISSKEFIKNVNWKDIKIENIDKISTHMGLENKDKLSNYTKSDLEQILKQNIEELKEKIGKNIQIGLENIPGGFEFDLNTITPEYVSENWGKADFGVFDMSHAKLSSKELNMTYEEYLKKLKNKEKVKILHISGNIDETSQYSNKPDKHVLIHENEIEDIIKTIQSFTNIELIISEYAYKTKYDYEKELLIEAIVLFTIVNSMDSKISKKVLEYLEKNLEENGSNIKKLISSKEWREINTK